MSKVIVMDHPLIQHKIGFIRKKDTGTKDFRQAISEIAMLICYEATRDLKVDDVEISTPICNATVKELKGKKSITKSGKESKVYANISGTSYLVRVLQNEAEGIGLCRSEFLYMQSND